MKKVFGFIVIAAVALSMASCFSSKKGSAANGGEVTGVGGTNFAEPSPYGMVLIKRGSLKMGSKEYAVERHLG